jgi:hypothetical protein
VRGMAFSQPEGAQIKSRDFVIKRLGSMDSRLTGALLLMGHLLFAHAYIGEAEA